MRTILFLLCCAHLQAQWTKLSDFPGTRRDDGVAAVVGDKAYFGSGLQEGWWLTRDFFSLDLINYTWASIKEMPASHERQYAVAFPGPGGFFVFGGDGSNGPLNNLVRYDVVTDTWTDKTPWPGGGLLAASCMVFGDQVIIVGGKLTGSGPVSNEVWQYRISTDTWTRKADFPFGARWRSSVAVLNGKGYLVFGVDDPGLLRTELYRYDPLADTWAKVNDFPGSGRYYASMEAGTRRLVLFGGRNQGGSYNDTWFFNDTTNTWSTGPALPGLSRGGGMSCLKGETFIYSCGLGQGDVRLNETWKQDVPVGIGERETLRFNLYPNPTNALLFIDTEETISYTLTDICGKPMSVNPGPPVIARLGAQIDLSAVQPGVYLLHLQADGRRAVRKIIKE